MCMFFSVFSQLFARCHHRGQQKLCPDAVPGERREPAPTSRSHRIRRCAHHTMHTMLPAGDDHGSTYPARA
ncbi:hypothetical protein VDGL01_06086 [Verticillium dahliae]